MVKDARMSFPYVHAAAGKERVRLCVLLVEGMALRTGKHVPS